jgi:hypothetical protein
MPGVDELHQAPGAGHGEQRIEVLRLDLLDIEFVRLDDGVDLLEFRGLVQVFVDIEEQRGMDVRLPGHEPVGRKRQHAAGRRFALDLLIQAQQALVGQVGLRLEDLQTGPQLDQRDGALDLPAFSNDALDAHGDPRGER